MHAPVIGCQASGGMDGIGDLERWAADARAREAADARVRERWLRAQAGEEASLAGLLLALAERQEAVVVTTTSGRRHRGTVAGVGGDFAAIEVAGGTTTLLSLASVADVRVVEGPGTTTSGAAALGARLADVLAQAAGQRPRVSVQAGANPVVGDLWSVGRDVLTVRTDGSARVAYVSLASVSEVSFLASG